MLRLQRIPLPRDVIACSVTGTSETGSLGSQNQLSEQLFASELQYMGGPLDSVDQKMCVPGASFNLQEEVSIKACMRQKIISQIFWWVELISSFQIISNLLLLVN